MKFKIILVVAAGLVFLAFISYPWGKNMEIPMKINENTYQTNQNTKKTLKIGEISLNVEIADTEIARTQGLSGKVAKDGDPIGLELGENEGMLFVFEREENYGFWMKDMNFAIDMAWLDKNKKIVYIESDVRPETYLKNPPQIFGSNVTSLYVLETPSEFLVKNNIKIGDFVAF
jgi:uncharacterized protein